MICKIPGRCSNSRTLTRYIPGLNIEVYIDGLVQERRNSSVLGMELGLTCTNVKPSIYRLFLPLKQLSVQCSDLTYWLSAARQFNQRDLRYIFILVFSVRWMWVQLHSFVSVGNVDDRKCLVDVRKELHWLSLMSKLSIMLKIKFSRTLCLYAGCRWYQFLWGDKIIQWVCLPFISFPFRPRVSPTI